MEYKNMLTGLIERVSGQRKDRASAGTKYRLMGLVADITEMVQTLQTKVLQRVSQEAVLDVDDDIDYVELSEQVLTMELPALADASDVVREQTQLVNEGLAVLSDVLLQINDQLERRHKDEEYAKLFEQEKRRYLSSGTPRRVRQTFDEWLYDVCNGSPTLDDINDYVIEKLVHMFEKGVFNSKVEHIQRATRYPGEFDFALLDDDHKLKKTVYKHYSELRKLVDYCDGCLVVNPVKVGRHFYTNRKEENAKGHRNAFLKYMHKIDMAQQERKKLLEAETAKAPAQEEVVLNYFAPENSLTKMLLEEWFGMVVTDEKLYDTKWVKAFVKALMASEWRDQIAREWSIKEKRLTLRCMVIGALKDAGVLRGSYNSIARLLDMDDENPATLAKYLGLAKKQPFAEWITDYVNS